MNVTHLGRRTTARQQTALDLLNIGCRASAATPPSTSRSTTVDWAHIHVTELANLDWFCPTTTASRPTMAGGSSPAPANAASSRPTSSGGTTTAPAPARPATRRPPPPPDGGTRLPARGRTPGSAPARPDTDRPPDSPTLAHRGGGCRHPARRVALVDWRRGDRRRSPHGPRCW